jgi:methanogenic corrinoid protein MtbC1
MAAAVFVDAGWQETNFGPQIPLDLLADAAHDRAARLVWLSISSAESPHPLRDQIISLANRLSAANVLFAVGGRCVAELHLAQIPHVSLMNTMADLNAIARANLSPVQPHQS